MLAARPVAEVVRAIALEDVMEDVLGVVKMDVQVHVMVLAPADVVRDVQKVAQINVRVAREVVQGPANLVADLLRSRI